MARNIRVELDLDTGKFDIKVKSATGGFQSLSKAAHTAAGSMGTMESQGRRALSTVRDLTLVVGQARNAFLNLRDAVFGWLGPVISANREIERASFLLQGMSTALTQVGRRTEAADNIRELLELAKSSPFSLDALTDSFVKMKAGGIDPMDGSMKSLVDAVATFGGDSQILNRASIAIQQMAGKGVISMEELRQQLGEAVPTAINLMARSLGVSYQELVDKISKGQVRANGALKSMFAEFDRTFGGASSRLVTSFGGSVQRAQSTLTQFALAIGGFSNGQFTNGSFMSELTKAVNDFTDSLNTGEAQKFAQQTGAALAEVVKWLKSMVIWLSQNIDLIVAIGRGLLIAFAGKLLLNGLTNIISMFAGMGRGAKVLAGEIALMQRGFAIAQAQITRVTTTGNLSSISFGRMAVAARTVGRAMLNMIPLIGQAVIVITTIADALGLFRDRAKEARKAFADFKTGIITQEGLEKARDGIDDLQKKIETISRVAAGKLDRSSLPFGFVNSLEDHPWGGGLNKQEEARFEQMKAELEQKKRDWQAAVNIFSNDVGESVGNRLIRNFEVQRAEFNTAYDELARDFQSQRDAVNASETMSEEEKKAKLEEIRQAELTNVREYYNQLVGGAEALYAQQKAITDKQIELDAKAPPNDRGLKLAEQNKKGYAAALRVLGEYISSLKEKRSAAFDLLAAPSPFTDGDSDKQKADPVKAKIIALQGDIAKLKGGYTTAAAAVDEFNAELEAGAYPNITEDQKKFIRALITEKETLDNTRQAANALADVMVEVNKTHEDAATAMESLWNGGLTRSDVQVENFRQKLIGMTDAMKLATGETEEWKKAVAAVGPAVNDFAITRQAQTLEDIRQSSEEMKKSLMGVGERRDYEYSREYERVMRLVDLNAFSGQERVRVEEMVYGYLRQFRDQYDNQIMASLKQQLGAWTELNKNIADGVTGWVDQMIDALVQGEFSFGKFAKSVLADLAKIIIRATIANAIISAINGYSAATAPPNLSQANMEATMSTGVFHSGGTVGLNKTMRKSFSGMFAGAMRYHTGGIAGLKPDEVPAILRRGERVSTEQQWKQLNSGQSSAAEHVQVNLINQSGTPLSSDQASTRFDGKQMILDVVISAMNRPGKMRETVKSVK